MTLPEPSSPRERALFSFPRLEEQPLWRELANEVRERLFPLRLPPLELTSSPVVVPDRMATSTNRWAFESAAVVNCGIVVLALVLGLRTGHPASPFLAPTDKFVIKEYPLLAAMRLHTSDGSNGGGANDPVEANRGRNPMQDMRPLAPVQVPDLENPKLSIENRIAVPPDVKLPDNQEMAMIGVHESANVTLMSGGPGGPAGIGTGRNGGDGPGNGQRGWGPGAGDGIYTPGLNGVSQPIPVFTPEAEFSDEARRHKQQGACTISVVIDAQGNPQNPRVVQPIGMGLDEKALQAVMRYRFKPAKKDGRPVAVRIGVVVDFRLF
ncbi:energy transducer TonB [Occallatibacter savannae]|uniref:energy transducer TonB n=1 Tax=Occallatibacter savannae TaxID=1002691 RepID=UPI000D6998BC|nr:energy transducer TonB [Occallatibacter savannae]